MTQELCSWAFITKKCRLTFTQKNCTLEAGGERKVQEGGDICIPMADSC